MKFMFFIMSIMVLSFSACHGVSPNPDLGGSSLKGVYDEDYVLKLSRIYVPEELYHFVTCPTQAFMDKNNSKLKPEESCVAAIRTSDNKSVVFEIDDIPMAQLALTDREKKAYLARQKEWKEYRKAQEAYEDRLATGAVMIGAGMGAGASYLGAINWRTPAKVRATQAFKRGKVISMVILGTVLSVAVLKGRQKQKARLEKAEAKVDALKVRHDDFHVLIGPSSVLLKKEQVEVSSVPDFLFYLSNLWSFQEGKGQVEDEVHRYCLPRFLSPKSLTSECFSVNVGQ